MILSIDTDSNIPIYQQIREQIILGIAKNELQVGESLPSVRQLADEIGVNMMTVSKAYTTLKEEGYIRTDRRNGTKVQQPDKADAAFLKQLTDKLELLAAEAKIHQVHETNMQTALTQIYQQFKN